MLRWLPLLALVACASAEPVARNATATTATVSVAPVAAPPPPARKVLGSSARIPLADVVKAVTPNRRVVVLGPRSEAVLADLKEEGFTGFDDLFPKKRGGTFEEVGLLPHDIVIVDIDHDDVPVFQRSAVYEGKLSPVVVRWRHRMGKRLYLEPAYVDTRCHEAVCDAFTIAGATLPQKEWDFSDLPLAEMMPFDGRPRRQ